MDKVVHFEIPVEDFERAKEFYTKAFDWKLESYPKMEYVIARSVEIDEKTHMPKQPGAINGGMLKRKSPINNPVITINVEDIDKSIELIKKSCGEIVMDKFQVGDFGLSAYFKDSEGNILGIWQELKKH